ncbi:hypothetical protein NCER_100296 [Vairimorpha ceranae BRL01]|uniref:Spindle pole body component n=1 Tax=Vairimorpha ceranae (strain BRL01) TaxID=578460 RepID=C4V774_VAIC1|nr:hypothetical protein NCER_100296 [Vairimorpha ceranae BRL01]
MTKSPCQLFDRNHIIIENMIFMLCGIDTEYLSIGMKNKKYALLLEGNYPLEYLFPFEEICINVRITHKFIFKNISYENCIKKIISDFFLKHKKLYLLKIEENRNTRDLETLYVSIQSFIELFRDFKFIIDACRTSDDSEIYYNIFSVLEKPIFKDLKKSITKHFDDNIINWIIYGSLSSSFFITEHNLNLENIEEGFWKSKYYLKPSAKSEENEKILKCGKLVQLLNCLDINIINYISQDIILKKGISGTLSFVKDITYNLLCKDLQYEIFLMEKYLLLQDMSFYSDLFTDLYNDRSFNLSNDFSIHSEENKKLIRKINLFKKVDMICFKLTNYDINNTIYKILNTDLQVKNNQSILEFITLDFNPKILKLILTKKDFIELEIIFRFLFTFSVIQFFLQKNFHYRFSKLMLCFVQHLKFSIFSDLKNIIFSDVDNLIRDINNTILKYLKNLFLISSDTYLILSQIIDLTFNFIGLDKKEECINLEEFEIKFFLIVKQLYKKLKHDNCDWWFLNALECLCNENLYML